MLLLTQLLFAQKSGTLSGKIVDSEQKALEKATVSILNPLDSALISYTLADDKGDFTLYKLPISIPIRLIVSYAGMETYRQDVTLTGEEIQDVGSVILLPRELNAVVIEAQPPVRFNNDSLEYNTAFFKTLPNATVEDLLKKLPGLQVNMDGTIYYQGKEVNKVLVNKKEFFAQDMRIATRNLDADMVQTVQVYRDRGDSKRKVDDESELPVTINLKFKNELAKADFGKFYGSGGTGDRYESGVLLNAFRDTLQVSFIGYGNNINKQSFDYSELSQYGGLARAENYGFNDFGGRNYQGVQNDMSGGLNVNYDWGEETKLNVLYQYTFGDALNENLYQSETFYQTERQTGASQNTTKNRNYKNAISGKFEHRFDTTAHFQFRPTLNFTKSFRNSQGNAGNFGETEPINESTYASDGNTGNVNYRHDFYVEKALNKKWILSLNHNISYSQNDYFQVNDQLNIVFAEGGEPVIRLIEEDNRTTDLKSTAKANVQHVFSEKVNVNFFSDYNYLRYGKNEEFQLGTDEGQMDERDDSENDLVFASRDYALGTRISWKIAKQFSVQAGVSMNKKQNSFDYRAVLPNREEDRLYWLPSFNVQFKELRLGYSRGVNPPSTYSIRSVENTMQYMGVTRIFPYAENILTDELNFNFNSFTDNYRTQFYTYGYFTRYSYSYGYSTHRDLSTGRYESETYIAPSAIHMNFGVNYTKRFTLSKDWQLQTNHRLSGNSSEDYRILNGVDNKNTNVYASLDNELTFSWKNIIAVSPKYTFSRQMNFASAKDPNFENRSSSSHRFTAGFNVTNVKNFTLETSYSLVMAQGAFGNNPKLNLVNMSVYYDMRKRGQLKLSVFDLLNQNESINHYSYGNSNNYSERNTLKQYFLLGYIYKFNKTKMK